MKTKKNFLWLAFLILATIWILARRNQQTSCYSIKGLVFGTVYKITYEHEGDLKPEIEAELQTRSRLEKRGLISVQRRRSFLRMP